MSALKLIDHEALAAAARNPDNRLCDLAAMFECSTTCIKDRLSVMGVKLASTTWRDNSRPAEPQMLTEDDAPLPAREERQAELREIQPWPAGIWFG